MIKLLILNILIVSSVFVFPQDVPSLDSLMRVVENQSGEVRAKTLLVLSSETRLKDLARSYTYAREALSIFTSLGNFSGKAKAGLELALCYFNEQKYSESTRTLNIAMSDARSGKDSVTYAYIITSLADIIEKEGRTDEAIRLHEEAFGIMMRFDEERGASVELASIGLIYWRRGDNLPALKLFREAYEIRKKLGLKRSMAMALNNIGVVYWRMGIYEKAFEAYSESYELRKTVNDVRGMIITTNNIGLIFLKLRNFPKAHEHFSGALLDSRKDSYIFGEAYSHFNLADYYLTIEKYDSALIHASISVSLYNSFKEHNSVANGMNYIGRAQQGLGNLQLAEKYFLAAIDTANIIDDKFSKSASYHALAILYMGKGKFNDALRYGKLAEFNSGSSNTTQLSADLNLFYSEIYRRTGDYRNAYNALSTYTALRDSQSVERLNHSMVNWQIQYEIQSVEKENLLLKTEKEVAEANLRNATLFRNFLILIVFLILGSFIWIYILYKKNQKADTAVRQQREELKHLNEELAHQNSALEETNKTKDKLFSIISHDLTSPFQALLGNSEILLSDIDNMSKAEIKEFAGDIEKASKNLLHLTRNLLTWSRVQTNRITIKPENIIAADLIGNVRDLAALQAGVKGISITISVNGTVQIYSDRQILSNILLNLLSNAIKFTESGGVINLSAAHSGDKHHVLLTVADNGVGIEPERLKMMMETQDSSSTEGTNREKGTGLGFLLTKELVHKLGGTISGESTLGQGSSFTVSLPVN